MLGYHNGDVDSWIDFFLEGAIEIAKEAIEIVGRITALRENDMIKIHTLGKRASESAMLVLPKLYAQPIVNIGVVKNWTGFTHAGAQKVIDRFIQIGILIPKDKSKTYGQSYMYKKYIDIFNGNE